MNGETRQGISHRSTERCPVSCKMLLRGGLSVALLVAWMTAARAELASVEVRQEKGASVYVAEGVVEAVRQTVVSGQVPGVISQLAVKAGDAVQAGQVLLRIDARAATQMSAASAASADAARTAFEVASKDYQRQKQLYDQEYISQAAMERAEAQYRAAQSQANAAMAQAQAARAQSGFYTLTAPYDGLVADVGVVLGDMAMPGRPLMTVYDPAALRVTATVPQARVDGIIEDAKLRVEIPGLSESRRWLAAVNSKILPKADASTHTMQIRLDLPGKIDGLPPGAFARVYLPVSGPDRQRLFVPAESVFRRAELTAVYAIDANGLPRLRQVKAGPRLGDDIEILSGVTLGERVAADPMAAARRR